MKRAEIPVPSPCTEDWDGMTGDAVRRRCERCAHDVHDLSEMSEPAARALLATRGQQGRLCVRYASDRTGTVRFRRRASRTAAAAVAVALMSPAADAALALSDGAEAVEEDRGLLGRLRERVRRWLSPEEAATEEEAVAEDAAAPEEAALEELDEDELLITAGLFIDE